MNCSHPVLYMRNGAMVCTVCGAVIDQPKTEKPPEVAAAPVTAAKKLPRPKKPAKDTAKQEEKNANG